MLTYHATADRPEAVLTLPDGADVTSGYTFTLKIGNPGSVALVTKTSNITGGAGQVTVAWVAGELAALDPGIYSLQLAATTGGLDRIYDTTFVVRDVVT